MHIPDIFVSSILQLVILELIDFKYAWNVSDIHSTWLISETVSTSVISKSVFRYCKVSFYPPNIDTVLFYGQYTNIDTDPQYPKICIEILVLPVFFSINIKKNLCYLGFILPYHQHKAFVVVWATIY